MGTSKVIAVQLGERPTRTKAYFDLSRHILEESMASTCDVHKNDKYTTAAAAGQRSGTMVDGPVSRAAGIETQCDVK